jgi:hypothetical protein
LRNVRGGQHDGAGTSDVGHSCTPILKLMIISISVQQGEMFSVDNMAELAREVLVTCVDVRIGKNHYSFYLIDYGTGTYRYRAVLMPGLKRFSEMTMMMRHYTGIIIISFICRRLVCKGFCKIILLVVWYLHKNRSEYRYRYRYFKKVNIR